MSIQFNTNKKYQIIYADPPWRYSDKGCNGSAENHYQTMNIKDICEMPVNEIADKNCVLF
ncbi:MT-A70 family methyltransferase, partial [Pasteurella multocida]